MPGNRIVLRPAFSNSSTSSAGRCQLPSMCSVLDSALTHHNSPSSQPTASQTYCSSFGVASERLEDSASARVTANCAARRRSVSFRDAISRMMPVYTCLLFLLYSPSESSSCTDLPLLCTPLTSATDELFPRVRASARYRE